MCTLHLRCHLPQSFCTPLLIKAAKVQCRHSTLAIFHFSRSLTLLLSLSFPLKLAFPACLVQGFLCRIKCHRMYQLSFTQAVSVAVQCGIGVDDWICSSLFCEVISVTWMKGVINVVSEYSRMSMGGVERYCPCCYERLLIIRGGAATSQCSFAGDCT